MTATEQQKYDELATPSDDLNDNALRFAHIVQLICKDENVPFNQGWILAQQKFPALYQKICSLRGGISAAAGPEAASVTSGAAVANSDGHFSPTLGTTVERVSPAQARAAFNDEVSRMQKERGMDFTTAWRDVADREKDLLARMQGDMAARNSVEEAQAKALPNSFYADDAPMSPLTKPANIFALGLPGDATDDEYRAAFMANGRKISPRNSQDILTSMIAYQLKKNGRNMAVAKDAAKTRYPILWDEAGDKPMAPRM